MNQIPLFNVTSRAHPLLRDPGLVREMAFMLPPPSGKVSTGAGLALYTVFGGLLDGGLESDLYHISSHWAATGDGLGTSGSELYRRV